MSKSQGTPQGPITSSGRPRAPAAVAIKTGSLSVVSDPPGSAVIVDGAARGQTPLTIRDLSAGRHEVLVRSSSATFQRSVQVEAGATASLVVGGAPAAVTLLGLDYARHAFPRSGARGRARRRDQRNRPDHALSRRSPARFRLRLAWFPAKFAGQCISRTRRAGLAYNSSRGDEHQRPAVGRGSRGRHADRRYAAGERNAPHWRSSRSCSDTHSLVKSGKRCD